MRTEGSDVLRVPDAEDDEPAPSVEDEGGTVGGAKYAKSGPARVYRLSGGRWELTEAVHLTLVAVVDQNTPEQSPEDAWVVLQAAGDRGRLEEVHVVEPAASAHCLNARACVLGDTKNNGKTFVVECQSVLQAQNFLAQAQSCKVSHNTGSMLQHGTDNATQQQDRESHGKEYHQSYSLDLPEPAADPESPSSPSSPLPSPGGSDGSPRTPSPPPQVTQLPDENKLKLWWQRDKKTDKT